MKEILKKLIDKWACSHDWELVKEVPVNTDFGGMYISLIFVCKKCGKFIIIKTNPG